MGRDANRVECAEKQDRFGVGQMQGETFGIGAAQSRLGQGGGFQLCAGNCGAPMPKVSPCI